MDIDVSALTIAASVAAFALGPAMMLLVDTSRAHRRPRFIPRAAGIAAIGAVCWLLAVAVVTPDLEPLLVLPVAGMAGFAAVLASIALSGRSIATQSAFAAAWSLAVFTPVAVAVLSSTDGLLGAALHTLDLGGALPVLVASGCAAAAILIAERRSPAEPIESPRPVALDVSAGAALGAAMFSAVVFAVVWVLWVVWLVGAELVVDAATPAIVANAIIAPVTSAVAWLIVQRIRHAKTTTLGAVGGLFCGLAAVTAGCGYLNPLGAAITGGVAGVVCSLVGYALVRRTGRAAWLLVTVLVGASSIGTVLLGVLATRSGAIFTGQPEVLFSQFASVVAVVVYSTTVSLLLWLGIRSATSLSEPRRAGSARA